MSIIFLDTETTNLLAVEAADLQNQPHIVEIFCIVTDIELNEQDTYHRLIRPPISIPNEAIKIHSITDDKVRDKKPFAAHYRELAKLFVGCTHMIGHNLQFDKKMIENELQRINKVTNFPWPPNQICTIEEIQKIKGHRISLSDIHEELFGYRFESAHSADADTRALLKVYKELVKREMVKCPTI